MQQFLRGICSKTEIKTPLEYCWTMLRNFLYELHKKMIALMETLREKKTLLAAGFEPRTFSSDSRHLARTLPSSQEFVPLWSITLVLLVAACQYSGGHSTEQENHNRSFQKHYLEQVHIIKSVCNCFTYSPERLVLTKPTIRISLSIFVYFRTTNSLILSLMRG